MTTTADELAFLAREFRSGVPGPGLPYLQGTSLEHLTWFRPFADAILSRVHEFEAFPIALVTVCSWAKPYSQSYVHYGLRRALFQMGLLGGIEYWHLSSAGMIPSELETRYPLCAYDWDNAEASEVELSALKEALKDYFERWWLLYGQCKSKVVTYFREGSNTNQAIALCKISSCGNPPCRVQAGGWSSEEVRKEVTLNGFYSDPDIVLLDVENLKMLYQALKDAQS